MTFESYTKEFTAAAIKSGYSEENLKACLDYSKVLFDNNVPVIYNTTHLSGLVGYKKSYLKRASLYTKFFYREFDVRKKNGKKRRISEPLPSLKEIQHWILKNILYKVKVSKYAKAYIPKHRLKQNLLFHKNQKQVLTVDIKDFFPSIKINSVEKIFKNLGYSRLLSSLLAKLCCLNGALPQGAPTSPYLTNIYLKEFDETLGEYCKPRKIMFTRYADDMGFSGDFEADELLNNLKSLLADINLELNDSKTDLKYSYERQTVTGIVVNQKPQVVFSKRNNLRQEIYYIKKFGLTDHMARKNIKKANYLRHIIGQVNFVLEINPNDKEFIEYKKLLLSLLD